MTTNKQDLIKYLCKLQTDIIDDKITGIIMVEVAHDQPVVAYGGDLDKTALLKHLSAAWIAQVTHTAIDAVAEITALASLKVDLALNTKTVPIDFVDNQVFDNQEEFDEPIANAFKMKNGIIS